MAAQGVADRPCALVLGSGAQGLTCALQLWAKGWKVVVLARDPLAETASWGAGAIWEFPPFHIEPEQAARRWVLASLGPLQTIASADAPEECGVRIRRSYYMFRDPARGREAFALAASPPGAVADLCEGWPPKGSLRPDAPHRYCFSYLAPVVSMSKYLPWLARRVASLGVRFEVAEVRGAADVAAAKQAHRAELVVNCLGLAAGHIFGDDAVHGVLGDLVYVKASGVEEDMDFAHISDEDHPGGLAYVIPQVGGTLALAGTAETVGKEVRDLRALARGPAAEARREGVRQRCRDTFGERLVGGEALGSWTGLRPQRSGGVRLELDETMGGEMGPVIHNYGHGGSGIMTAWGCASDVVGLASRVADTKALELRARYLPSDLAAAVAAIGRGSAAGVFARL